MHNDVIEAHTELVQDGFFHEPTALAAPTVDGNRFHHVPVDGLPRSVQFFRVSVAEIPCGALVEHLIVGAYSPPLEGDLLQQTAAALRGVESTAGLWFITDARIGSVSAQRLDGAPKSSLAFAAAAMATVLASASWDESDPIVVSVNGATFAVSLTWEGNRWRARVGRPEAERSAQ